MDTNAVGNLANILGMKRQHKAYEANLHMNLVSLSVQANLYKRFMITTNALPSIGMACDYL